MLSNLSAQYLLEQAESFKNDGKYLHSIQIYISLINNYPYLSDAFLNLAEIYSSAGFSNQAVNIMKYYIDRNPDVEEAKLYTANLLMRDERWTDTLNFLSDFRSMSEPTSEFFKGYCYFRLKNFEQAENYLSEYIRFEGKTDFLYEALLYLSKCEIEMNKLNLALKHLKLCGAYYEDFWEWNLLIAKVYALLRMETHALKYINRALKQNEKKPGVLKWAARIYSMNDKPSEADKFYSRLVNSADIISADIHNEYADFCKKNSKIKQAIIHYKLALKIEPGNSRAKTALHQLKSVSEKKQEK
ncbi:MAG: hypothetical protein Kow0098_10430 [Ignavibacteriaceae bacterium]